MKHLSRLFLLLTTCLLLVGAARTETRASDASPVIGVGSKTFPENYILAEIGISSGTVLSACSHNLLITATRDLTPKIGP